MTSLLFVVSSATELALADGTPHTVGYWPEEVLKPYERFVSAGVDVVVATPDGQPPTPDPFGLEPRFHYPDEDEDFLLGVVRTFADDAEDIRMTLHQLTELDLIAARVIHAAAVAAGGDAHEARTHVERAARTAWVEDRSLVDVLSMSDGACRVLPASRLRELADEVHERAAGESRRVANQLASIEALQHPRRLGDIDDGELAAFDGVFFPGGHGPMVDLADNGDVDRVVRQFHGRGAVVSALCHGPAALLSVGNGFDGSWLFDGYRMTVFSDEEEDQVPVGIEGAPWYVEDELRNRGAVVDNAAATWVSHVVVDRNVVTAQNPASSEAAADAVLKSIGAL